MTKWREMPKLADGDMPLKAFIGFPMDPRFREMCKREIATNDALRERLRDTAKYAQHDWGCGYIGVIQGTLADGTVEVVDHKDTCTCGLWAILKRLKDEGLA